MLLPTQETPLPCRINLCALDPERNIAREYYIEATSDLFGHWIIELRWGRIGTRGQTRSLSFDRQDAAQKFIRQTLVRRSGAKKRIGVPYIPVWDTGSLHFSN